MINIEEIKAEIEKEHKKFLSKYSASLAKVIADEKLITELILVKVKYIVNAFIEKKIVDYYKDLDYAGNKAILIGKNNINHCVEIITDGGRIVIRGIDGVDNYVHPGNSWQMFEDVWRDNFDWNNFSKFLLSCVHEYVYSRKRAFAVKIDNLFKEPT